MASFLCVFVWLWLTIISGVTSQFLSIVGMPFGCRKFQYYNSSIDASNPPPIIRDALNEVDQLLDYLATISQVPSVSFGIVYDQQLLHYKSYGATNLKTEAKPTADSIYRIGSISKVFTVLMAYIMRDQGTIDSFNDPIYKYNERFSIQNPWGITAAEKQGHTLTIQQLASQIGGFQRWPPCTFEGVECVNITTTEILERLATESLIHPTDVQASYSNLAYALLGNILAEHDGESTFNETVFDLILEPLSMTHTGLYLNANQQKYAATGYNPDFSEANWTDIGWVGPAGQLFSSVNDLATFMKQYFAAYPSLFQTSIDADYPFVTSPQTLREMLRPVFVNPDQRSGFGAPWEMQMVGDYFLRGKGGNINGFSSSIQMVPEMKLGVIALSNFGVDESRFTLSPLEVLIPAFASWSNSMQAAGFNPVVPNNAADYVGYYAVNEVPVFEIARNNKTGHLMLSSRVQQLYGVLTWQGSAVNSGDSFVFNDLFDDFESCWIRTLSCWDGSTLEFVRDSRGKVEGVMVNGLNWGFVYTKKEKAASGDKEDWSMRWKNMMEDRKCGKERAVAEKVRKVRLGPIAGSRTHRRLRI